MLKIWAVLLEESAHTGSVVLPDFESFCCFDVLHSELRSSELGGNEYKWGQIYESKWGQIYER